MACPVAAKKKGAHGGNTVSPVLKKARVAGLQARRRGRDLNPRRTFRPIRDFQSRSLDRSDTSPGAPGYRASVATNAYSSTGARANAHAPSMSASQAMPQDRSDTSPGQSRVTAMTR